jgi:hypothetical protein
MREVTPLLGACQDFRFWRDWDGRVETKARRVEKILMNVAALAALDF